MGEVECLCARALRERVQVDRLYCQRRASRKLRSIRFAGGTGNSDGRRSALNDGDELTLALTFEPLAGSAVVTLDNDRSRVRLQRGGRSFRRRRRH